MKRNGRSIDGCTASAFQAPQDCRYTQNGKRRYVQVYAWPFKHLHLNGLAGQVAYAQFLHDASEVRIKTVKADPENNCNPEGEQSSLLLELPVRKPNVTVPTIELFLQEE